MPSTSTNTLQRSINYATIMARGAPLSNVLSIANEPALTIGDYVRQFILGPPFAWRWNRSVTAFNAVAGVQDYSLTSWVANSGMLVGWIVIDTNGNQQSATTAGNTGATQPVWNTTQGGTTSDGSVVWVNQGSVSSPVSGYKAASISNFGWLEKAVIIDSNNLSFELGILLNLGNETVQNQPFKIAPLSDLGGNGGYAFRLLPPPEQNYTVVMLYQRAAPSFVELTDTWFPLPDYMSFLYNQGTVAKTYEYMNRDSYLAEQQLFLRQTIAFNAGLTASQVNIFLADRIINAREGQEEMGTSQSGRQGRGAF